MNSVPTQQESTKRWWHLLFPPVVETHEGLFRPSNLALDLAVPAVCGVLVLVSFVCSQSQGKANYVALFLTLVCIWGTARSWLEWKKFGAMGRPLVRINETTIFLALPENLTQRQVELQLVDIKALVIQGEASQRTFVFERHEGGPIKAKACLGRLDTRIVDFLRQKMPAAVPVRMQRPSSLFGFIRGD